MSVLRLRGQSLSVLISALYLIEGDASAELELAREDVLNRQILLQDTDRLSSLMWKAIAPLLTQEWGAFRVASAGLARKIPGRVALLDSTQALIELEDRPALHLTEASNWPSQSTIWLPDLEDWRLEAKIVAAEGLQDLREPVAAEVGTDDPAGTYAQYIPLGGGQTMFMRYRCREALSKAPPRELADNILDRLRILEEFLLAEI
jgi:hypothetical protein